MSRSSPFGEFASTFERIRSTTSKKEKVSLFADYLAGLSPEDARIAARFATGRASEKGSREEAQVGHSTLLQVLKEVTGASDADVSASYRRHGDLGQVAEELLDRRRERTLFEEPLTLGGIEESFGRMRSAKGKGSAAVRRGVAKSLLLRASPLEAKYVTKILTGEMRTGLVHGLLEEAVALAYSISREEAARAHMVIGDAGEFAMAAAKGSVSGLRMTPFHPVNFMLAEPMQSAGEIAEHFGKTVYAEFKYDGVRAQVHKSGQEVRIFSRRLEDITSSFPEVAKTAGALNGDFILDGEIVPFSEGKPLAFQLLQRRLRRMEEFRSAADKAPVVYFAFDILYRNGMEEYAYPLRKRRRILGDLFAGSKAQLAHSVDVRTEKEVEAAFTKSRQLGYEGLVVKDPDSVYTMGRRGSGWVKLKEELDTLDVVIVAAELGHGKRVGVISDYTFAVRDGDSLKTIGKAYSGLTDEEIEGMTGRLKRLTVKDYGYRRTVKPEIVLEVAFDSIQKSDRHDSGYALRFPRIKRIRTDKGPADIDTLEKVESVFLRQKVRV